MKFRRLPLEERLEAIARDQGDEEMVRIRSAEFLATMKTPGFQLVTGVLRELERAAYSAMITTERVDFVNRYVGHLQAIQSIRLSLIALLPDGSAAQVDWFDDQDEEFNVDPSPTPRADEDAE